MSASLPEQNRNGFLALRVQNQAQCISNYAFVIDDKDVRKLVWHRGEVYIRSNNSV
jgi:hypothetical protein